MAEAIAEDKRSSDQAHLWRRPGASAAEVPRRTVVSQSVKLIIAAKQQQRHEQQQSQQVAELKLRDQLPAAELEIEQPRERDAADTDDEQNKRGMQKTPPRLDRELTRLNNLRLNDSDGHYSNHQPPISALGLHRCARIKPRLLIRGHIDSGAPQQRRQSEQMEQLAPAEQRPLVAAMTGDGDANGQPVAAFAHSNYYPQERAQYAAADYQLQNGQQFHLHEDSAAAYLARQSPPPLVQHDHHHHHHHHHPHHHQHQHHPQHNPQHQHFQVYASPQRFHDHQQAHEYGRHAFEAPVAQHQADYVNLDGEVKRRGHQEARGFKASPPVAYLPESVIRVNSQAATPLVLRPGELAGERARSGAAYDEQQYDEQSAYRHGFDGSCNSSAQLTVLDSARGVAGERQRRAESYHKFASTSMNSNYSSSNANFSQADETLNDSSYGRVAHAGRLQHDELLLSSNSALAFSGSPIVRDEDDEALLYDQSGDHSRLQLSSMSAHSQSQSHSCSRNHNTDHHREQQHQQQQQKSAEDLFKVCEWLDCGNTFLSMVDFVRHLEEEHVNQEPSEKNRYFCLWSNCKRNKQEFNARYKLLIHMRVHSGEKPYACDALNCPKSFSRLENLKIHKRSHTGDKPYKCLYESCSKSFTNSSDRIKHHKTHKDPKPYNCTSAGCTKRYTDPSSLRKHLRAHRRQDDAAPLNASSSASVASTLGRGAQLSFQLEITPSATQPPNERDSLNQSYSQSYAPEQQFYHDQHLSDSASGTRHFRSAQPASHLHLPADYDPAKEFEGVFHEAPAAEFLDLDEQQRAKGTALSYSQVPASRVSPRRPALPRVHQLLSHSWSAGGPTRFEAVEARCPQQSGPPQSGHQQQLRPNGTAGSSAERAVHWQPAPMVARRSQQWQQQRALHLQHEQLMRSMPAGPNDLYAAVTGADHPDWTSASDDDSFRVPIA